jgi:hypothetical protein
MESMNIQAKIVLQAYTEYYRRPNKLWGFHHLKYISARKYYSKAQTLQNRA